MQNRFYL